MNDQRIVPRNGHQYMVRFPTALRDRLARQAKRNGRSMNTEIVEAVQQHLTRGDRVAQMWAFMQEHRANIEAIPLLLQRGAREP